jgi:hypothetical protein
MRQRLGEKHEQLRVLKAEIDLLESMLAEATGQPDPSQPKPRAKRSSVKAYVLDLLEQVAANGLNAAIAVEMAEAEGKELDRNSVSSLLSRLKHDKTVEYDGDRYRLSSVMQAKRAQDEQQNDRETLLNVHPHPASGRAMSS